jgi:hypothetical protein
LGFCGYAAGRRGSRGADVACGGLAGGDIVDWFPAL